MGGILIFENALIAECGKRPFRPISHRPLLPAAHPCSPCTHPRLTNPSPSPGKPLMARLSSSVWRMRLLDPTKLAPPAAVSQRPTSQLWPTKLPYPLRGHNAESEAWHRSRQCLHLQNAPLDATVALPREDLWPHSVVHSALIRAQSY
jgi:hypothetical protein